MIYGYEEFLKLTFEPTEGGYFAYKIFNSLKPAPKDWVIKENSWIVDANLNRNEYLSCAAGINVAKDIIWIEMYIREECGTCDLLGNDYADVWKVFIPDDATIVVPMRTVGKIRADRIQLLEIVQQLPYVDDYDEDSPDTDDIIYAGS